MTALDSLLSRQPWLITTDAMHSMAAQTVAFFDSRLTLPESSSNQLLSVEDGVGLIRIHGPLMRDPDLISSLLFGATDMNQVAEVIQEAVARDDVKSILLDINSPGGTVNGTPELAQAVADASKLKSTYAFSAGQMCSAGDNATFADWYADDAAAISDARSYFTSEGYHVESITASHGEVRAANRFLPALHGKILTQIG